MRCIESSEREVYSEALNCLANLMSGDGETVIVWALQGGFLPRALEILQNGATEDRKFILWSLSNITGSVYETHISTVLEEDLLMQYVASLMSHENIEIKGEATWVVTNGITCSGHFVRANFA